MALLIRLENDTPMDLDGFGVYCSFRQTVSSNQKNQHLQKRGPVVMEPFWGVTIS
jgi:hypothetical protein